MYFVVQELKNGEERQNARGLLICEFRIPRRFRRKAVKNH